MSSLLVYTRCSLYFFFQAEDGIRDGHVTGVQTCALPILVLQQAGLPVEGIAMIIGVDRLLDMVRTSVNVTGDALVSTVVADSEGLLDRDRFKAPRGPI